MHTTLSIITHRFHKYFGIRHTSFSSHPSAGFFRQFLVVVWVVFARQWEIFSMKFYVMLFLHIVIVIVILFMYADSTAK